MIDPVAEQVLAYLNYLRAMNGVPQVHYANTGYAKFRADYMLKVNQLRAYHEGGIPGYYFFNRRGHYFYMEENSTLFIFPFPTTKYNGIYSSDETSPTGIVMVAQTLLNNLVYDDSEYGWLHRDSLLNPCFNYADVHAGENDKAYVLVVAMINARVSWLVKPNYDGKVVRFEGRVHSGFEPSHVIITKLVPDPRKVEGWYAASYGDRVARVAPEPDTHQGIDTIRPTEWVMDSSYVKVAFPFTPKEKGLYTIFLVGRDKRGIRWVPYSKAVNPEYCPLMMYTILV